MTKTAYFDCISGISGDMTLGALVDLGVNVESIEAAIQSMGLPELKIEAETVKKCGFRAIKVHITHPPEHAHRHLHHIAEMIDRATGLNPKARKLAHEIFLQVAEAEAKVHGSTLEKVHFHEVGAIDSIADIVGTAFALDQLGIENIYASPIPTGHGWITIAHGRVSVPAPATAEILKGVPLAESNLEAELTTPTGAAILKATASGFGPLPPMRIREVGYGAGTKDFKGQANVLRVVIGESEPSHDFITPIESDQATVLETNLDDCSPEQLADCTDRLLEGGALDVYQTACMMKKGRVGTQLTVLCAAPRVGLMESIIFEHTSAIGIRRYVVDRHKLPRENRTVETKFGPIRVKVVTLPSGESRLKVEDADAREVAKREGVSSETIRQHILKFHPAEPNNGEH